MDTKRLFFIGSAVALLHAAALMALVRQARHDPSEPQSAQGPAELLFHSAVRNAASSSNSGAPKSDAPPATNTPPPAIEQPAQQPFQSQLASQQTSHANAVVVNSTGSASNAAPATAPPSAQAASESGGTSAPGAASAANAASNQAEIVSTDATYAYPLQVDLPAISRQLDERGRVVVRAQIGADGRATNPSIYTSSGLSRLDNAALKAVAQGQYVPATRDGVAQTRWFRISINFVD